MQTETLLQRYAASKRDFSWADLEGADLSHQDLSGINLYRANLTNTNLQGTNLHKANLFKADLTNANLTNTNLQKANLCKANLQAAIVQTSQLETAKLRDTILPDGTRYQPPTPEPIEENTTEQTTPESNLFDLFDLSAPPCEREANLIRAQLEACENIAFKRINSVSIFQTNDPLWCLGMLCLIIGFLCFGIVIRGYQLPVYLWLLVWSSIFAAEGKPESVWIVPVTAGAIATLFIDISIIHLVLTGFLIILNAGGMLFYGSIVNQRARKTFQDGLFLCALCFVLLNLNLFIGAGILITTIGLLFLLRDSTEVMKIVAFDKKKADPWVRRRLLAERKRYLQLFSIAALIGLLAGSLIASSI